MLQKNISTYLEITIIW